MKMMHWPVAAADLQSIRRLQGNAVWSKSIQFDPVRCPPFRPSTEGTSRPSRTPASGKFGVISVEIGTSLFPIVSIASAFRGARDLEYVGSQVTAPSRQAITRIAACRAISATPELIAESADTSPFNGNQRASSASSPARGSPESQRHATPMRTKC